MDHRIYGGGENCGKTVKITYNGHTEYAKVRDRCENCRVWNGIGELIDLLVSV
jgi:hypothetical protein